MVHPAPAIDLDGCLKALESHLISIYARWNVLLELFSEGPENIALINRTLPQFFVMLQFCYVDDVIMGIGRLLDPATTGNNENLTLATLQRILASSEHQQLAQEIAANIETIKRLEAPLRDHRNKRIAHFDYRIAMKTEEIPPFFISNISESLRGISSVLNRVSAFMYNSTTEFDALDGEGKAMILYLRKAEAQFAQERAYLLAKRQGGKDDDF